MFFSTNCLIFKQNNWGFFYWDFFFQKFDLYCKFKLVLLVFWKQNPKFLTFKKWKKTTMATSPSLHHNTPKKKKKKI